MTTVLKRFNDAYATMTVAVYEPLVVQWYSQIVVKMISDHVVDRARFLDERRAAGPVIDPAGPVINPVDPVINPVDPDLNPAAPEMNVVGPAVLARGLADVHAAFSADAELQALVAAGGQRRVNATTHPQLAFFRSHPAAELADGVLYPFGALIDDANGDGNGAARAPIPVIMRRGALSARDRFNAGSLRSEVTHRLLSTIAAHVDADDADDVLYGNINANLGELLELYGLYDPVELLPVEGTLLEFLSPIGVAHFYRQLYYHVKEGVGPIEQAFTVAPKETLEITMETVRRQSHEEVTELGSEQISETAAESKNLDEVSDKVATLVERDSTAAMSTNASFSSGGSIGVWQASANASIGGQASLQNSSSTANDIAKRRLKEVTKRASERITKSFSLKVTDQVDFTTSSMTRRVISNKSAAPVSYGLRRVFNRVRVHVQDLGPSLVWQLYVREPGSGLAHGSFVHFSPNEAKPSAGDPPAVRPRPSGGTDTGTQSATLQMDADGFYVTLSVNGGPDRTIKAVSIDSITDLEHLAKDDLAPSPLNNSQFGAATDASGTYTVSIRVLPGDAASVSVSYTYVFEPSADVLRGWEGERQAAGTKFAAMEADAREKALRDEFERQRTLITLRSKIRPRPSADLRREERFEVLNRMVSHLFRPTTVEAAPSPLEIELFSRYFDIDGIFTYTHPSWWRPRYVSPATGLGRPPYPITNESDPAPLGSSLGWMLQLDADDRRNEFLNSPWVRVCIPIRPGRERAAVAWLAKHLEGEVGYDPTKNPLKALLTDFERRRAAEAAVAGIGPDYITVDSTIGAPGEALEPVERAYPIIDTFEATVPTDGFVYDALDVQIP